MQRRFVTTIFLLTSLIVTNCDRSRTATQLIQTFSDNKPKLTAIVKNIQTSKVLDSLFSEIGPENGIPDIETRYWKQYEMLEEVGITDASAHKGACPQLSTSKDEQDKRFIAAANWQKAHFKNKWYYFKTNWQSDHPVFLIYNECDTAKTHKGFYEKDEYQNETWGLGDNWEMFRLIKYKDFKQ